MCSNKLTSVFVALFISVFACLAQAQAQIPMTGAGIAKPAASAAPAWVFTDNPAPITAGGSTNTFTAVNIGTASASRIVVVVHSSTATVATGCTIGGVTATKAVEESSILSGLQIWYANVTSGTTGDVVLTAGGTMSNATIIVGALTGVTATPTATTSSTSANPATVTITVPSTGFAVVGNNGDSTAGTWTNATQDARTVIVVGTVLVMAHTGTAGSQTPSYSGGNVGHNVAAAWGP